MHYGEGVFASAKTVMCLLVAQCSGEECNRNLMNCGAAAMPQY